MRQKLLKVGQELLREIRGRRPAWRSAVRLEILRLLLALTREWRPPGEAGNPSQMSAGKLTRVRPALDLAHARLATSVSVAEAAEACNLSRSQFCLVFRDAMGLSYGRFCGRLRLGLAAKLLLSTDVSIASIAQRTGYVDASHLHRAFAKQYGCTPGAYRMQHRPQLHTRTAPSPT
jgi:transcriptional regulator GlxA family with amidase domain